MRYKFTIISVIILLMISIAPVQGALPWNEGDIYSFTATLEMKESFEPIDSGDPSENMETTATQTISMEIIDMDSDELTLEVESISTGGQRDNMTWSVNATEMGNGIFDFYADYDLDADGKKHLVSAGFLDPNFYGFIFLLISAMPIYFVEPEWNDFNDAAVEDLDPDTVVALDPTDNSDITLENLLDDAKEYSINGEKDLGDASDALDNSDVQKWDASVDFSQEAEYVFYDVDDEEWVYVEYDVYTASFALEYDNDGVLKNLEFTFESEVTTDYATIKNSASLTLSSGDGVAGIVAGIPGFELPLVLLAIAIPIIIKRKK
ncbi:MAG: hypothetical protein INQ03_23800 [Candidatus Heimdallarchaeota archaeon]|nr:hypothetical protein [Candidatus Heimdallarchaeota archaeon]